MAAPAPIWSGIAQPYTVVPELFMLQTFRNTSPLLHLFIVYMPRTFEKDVHHLKCAWQCAAALCCKAACDDDVSTATEWFQRHLLAPTICRQTWVES